MGPTQNTNQQNGTMAQRKGAITRSQNSANIKHEGKRNVQPKRKAEGSPKEKTFKRSAFGDITNALGKTAISQDIKNFSKKVTVTKPAPKDKDKCVAKVTALPAKSSVGAIISKTQTVKSSHVETKHTIVKQKDEKLVTSTIPSKDNEKKTNLVSETQQNSASSKDSSSDDSLYVSALEDLTNDGSSSQSERVQVVSTLVLSPECPVPESSSNSGVPEGVDDFDKETLNDPFQVSLYAMDIFNYLKKREVLFKTDDYMEKQPSISQWMRSLLVDWMVEVQESFELNHETLYLAVKLVDLYLTKIIVGKETLQLIGAATMFIASKYDERIPPLVEDFLYICDGAYTHRELIKMECNVLKVVDFDLGIPLSYRFLRRYARCAKLSLPTLTLARYILELSLMEYSFVSVSSSKLAAAALLLALKVKVMGGWTPTLEYYSGYKLIDIKDLTHQLNAMLHRKPKAALATVRNKYSHKIFFEVAKIPLLEKLDI